MEKRNQKILFLWLMIICGFACHTLTDILPMFWGKDMAMVATTATMATRSINNTIRSIDEKSNRSFSTCR